MPEAVVAYSATRHFADVTPVHQSIVDTYQDDFAKYASARVRLRLQRVFNYVPRAVGRKVKYTHIDREETARELRVAIDLLAKGPESLHPSSTAPVLECPSTPRSIGRPINSSFWTSA